MQLHFSIPLDTPLTLPVCHHHILQSILYKLMSDESGYTSLHDSGENYGKRTYKLFTFGPLEGEKRQNNRYVTFYNEVHFEFRSADTSLAPTIIRNVKEKGITFGDICYTKAECIESNEQITAGDILIRMISPIVVYKTDVATHHTYYFKPDEPEFPEAVKQNFMRKYQAATGHSPSDDFTILPISIENEDKYLTKYKNFIIEGYKGIYQLRGNPESLDFLYQAGLGSKNSQGFGMFSPISLS